MLLRQYIQLKSVHNSHIYRKKELEDNVFALYAFLVAIMLVIALIY